MIFFRLIKPEWGKKEILQEKNGKKVWVANPKFVREIEGPDTLGDKEFSPEQIQARNEDGYNVYYFPNHPSKAPGHKFFNGKDIDIFNYVFVDMDLKDQVYPTKEAFLSKLDEFPVKPSMTVDSGNGIHAYWQIENLNRDLYIHTQLVLIQHFKTDDSVWTPLQLMRFPGSVNTKDPNQYKPASVLASHSSERVYPIEQILEHLPEITPENEQKMLQHINRLEGRETADFESLLPNSELPERFVSDLKRNKKLRELFEDPIGSAGDRSRADMALANLLFSLDYEKSEALQVLMNTKKSRARTNPMAYAYGTVDKVYSDRPKYVVENAFDRKKRGQFIKNLGVEAKGPSYWDCLHHPWRTKQVLGLVAGSGVGKTTVTLAMFKTMIESHPDQDYICVFFSLEMTEGEIYDRWDLLVGRDSELGKKLYVVTNEDDEGNTRHIGLQEIYWYCRDIQKSKGKKILAVAIDHVDAISRHIDLTKQPSFKIEGVDRENYSGDFATISKGVICSKMKELSKKLDVFLIIQSQTTKSKDAGGDVALGKNAAYGVSNFEWYCDYIITLWRPLKRVQDKTELRITGWQYCKIRAAHKLDGAQEYIPYMLKFDSDTGNFCELSEQELQVANGFAKQAEILRKKEDKREANVYQNSPIRKLTLIYTKYQEKKAGSP